MMHIPMQKWQGHPDKTLQDYIQRKTDVFYDAYPYESDKKVIPMTDESVPPKKTFEEYMNEKIETPVGLRTREHAWGEQRTAIAREVWMEARK